MQLQINRGEGRHQLARRLFFANQGAFQTGDYEEIMNKATCLSLLSNAALVWNTVQMSSIAEEIEPRPAKHLALEHLQAIDVPFDRALTPGPRDPGFHGGVILTQPFGKAPEGRESARGGARQPRIELGRLALADEGGEVLCERHGFRQLGRLRGQLRQL